MDAITALLSRRSIRKFTDEQVKDKDVKDILDAAMSAPSAGNQQPWEFIVITDREILKSITTVHPHAQMLNDAPIAILLCADLNRERHIGYWVQDLSASTENILICAHAKGFGAVWLGVYPRDDRVNGLRKLFSLPENIVPFAIIPFGYPAEEKHPPNRFDPVRIHKDKW